MSPDLVSRVERTISQLTAQIPSFLLDSELGRKRGEEKERTAVRFNQVVIPQRQRISLKLKVGLSDNN